MLATLRDFFEKHIAAPAAEGDARHTIEVAAAALLLEMARIDAETQPAELAAVQAAVREKFALSTEEADALLRLAEEEAREATGYYPFTSLINKSFSPEQKERLIEAMWRVAYADAEISAHERHLMRKIADLLYVPHGVYIAAKMRARETSRG